MEELFFSKTNPTLLLHKVVRLSHVENQSDFRRDLIDPNNFIQCSSLRMDKGKTFRPHKHIEKSRKYDWQIAQESWVVLRGSVQCIFYDLDGTIMGRPILYTGDASFTLKGGHNYLVLEDNTIVYEFKTGPYEGQEFDKVFIDGKP